MLVVFSVAPECLFEQCGQLFASGARKVVLPFAAPGLHLRIDMYHDSAGISGQFRYLRRGINHPGSAHR